MTTLARSISRALAGVLIAGSVATTTPAAAGVAPGTLLWSSDTDSGRKERVIDAAAGAGLVVVTTRVGSSTTGFDIVTIAYDQADGSEAWSHTLDLGADDRPTSVEIAPDGDTVYVASQQAEPSSTDQHVVALDADDGTQRWLHTQTVNASWQRGLEAMIALDDRVITVATKQVPLLDRPPDTGGCRLVALDEADGTELWSRSIGRLPCEAAAGPAGGTMLISGVVNTGTIDDPAPRIRTWRIDPVAGSIEWRRSHPAPTSGFPAIAEIALDPAGATAAMVIFLQAGPCYARQVIETGGGDRLWKDPGRSECLLMSDPVLPDSSTLVMEASDPPRQRAQIESLDAGTGDRAWAKTIVGTSGEVDDLVISGTSVLHGGLKLRQVCTPGDCAFNFHPLTVALDLADGSRRWRTTYPARVRGDRSLILADPASPSVVFRVAAAVADRPSDDSVLVLAYQA